MFPYTIAFGSMIYVVRSRPTGFGERQSLRSLTQPCSFPHSAEVGKSAHAYSDRLPPCFLRNGRKTIIHTRAVYYRRMCITRGRKFVAFRRSLKKRTLHPISPFLWLGLLYKLFSPTVNRLFKFFCVFYKPTKFFCLICAKSQ